MGNPLDLAEPLQAIVLRASRDRFRGDQVLG